MVNYIVDNIDYNIEFYIVYNRIPTFPMELSIGN